MKTALRAGISGLCGAVVIAVIDTSFACAMHLFCLLRTVAPASFPRLLNLLSPFTEREDLADLGVVRLFLCWYRRALP